MVASDASPSEMVIAISISRLNGIAKRFTIIPNQTIGMALMVKPTKTIAFERKIHPVIIPMINSAKKSELASSTVWLYFALQINVA